MDEKENNDIKNIHTYQSDMADLVREKNASVINIAVAEQKKREVESLTSEKKINKTKNIFWVVGGIGIIIFGILGTIFILNKDKEKSIAKNQEQKIPTVISYEDQVKLDVSTILNKEDLTKLIKEEVVKELDPGKIKTIFLTQQDSSIILDTNQFLELVNFNLPGNLSRSLTEKFMLGVFSPLNNSQTQEKKNHLFLVFQTNDYGQAFMGMLDWEKIMLNDMFLLFEIDNNLDLINLINTPFKDKIISNKDSRVLYNSEGNGILYYLFVDNNTFIITDDQATIQEILSRLITKSIKPL